ncbi:zinc-dependent alcohol dehydrogenase family protein [Dokdonella sp.]|uniref:zinc-dependent alcohol dehydrogenase family protein n=1 Tax=Dokdonella sp. TaxID=2291710 RepID=UPI0039C86832
MHDMRAAVLEEHGGDFNVTRVRKPTPQQGQVVVRIVASGVNPLDTKIRAGRADHARHPLPAILGMDLAGVVDAVGPGVNGFRVGDEVWGMTGGVGGLQGSLAEFAAVDADLLALKPARLSMREAAATPLIFITAWEGLVDRADVRRGQTVLVQGGGGGVGHMAVQIAKARGARVHATDRTDRAGFLAELGASPIDRERAVEDYVAEHTDGKGFDVVYDTVGGSVLDASFRAVKRFGHVVSALGWGTHSLAPLSFRAASYSGVFTLLPILTGEGRARHGEILREAARMADAGMLMPRLDDRRYSLGDVADAHAAIENRTANGKLVVDIAD